MRSDALASIQRDIEVDVPLRDAWDALRDVGNIHRRLVPGFVADCRMEGRVRVVTFGNGSVLREPILDVDDARHRVAWAGVGGTFEHYNASVQAFELDGDRVRLRGLPGAPVAIVDLAGRRVCEGRLDAEGAWVWNGRDASGRAMISWRAWFNGQRGMLLALAIFVLLFALYLANHPAIVNNGYTLQGVGNVVQTAANKGILLALIAIAQTFVVLTAGIDLSVGTIFVLCNVVASFVVVFTSYQ